MESSNEDGIAREAAEVRELAYLMRERRRLRAELDDTEALIEYRFRTLRRLEMSEP
jgi:phage host-nuclease inhibitor protein Gam